MPRALSNNGHKLWKTWAWPRILWIEAGQWRWYWREKLHLDKFGHWEWEHEFKTCPTGDRHCNHYHWKWGKMQQIKVLQDVPDLRIVVFQWSAQDGECQECGLPAAFYDTPYGTDEQRKLCAVCAANSAADGETIRRIRDID